MIYVEQIEIISDQYPRADGCLKIGTKFECSDINIFVGEQGCGKSTLLSLLSNHGQKFKASDDIKLILSKEAETDGVSMFYFDSEKDNPRMRDPEDYAGQEHGFITAALSRFRSHGEELSEIVISPLLTAKDCVIILDEPESGLSVTNQYRLINAIKKAVENNCQLFIATHCYPIIDAFDVISLEHNKEMSGKEFLKIAKQQKP